MMENITLTITSMSGRNSKITIGSYISLSGLKQEIKHITGMQPEEQRICCWNLDRNPIILWSRSNHLSLYEIGVKDGAKFSVI